jgi:uncharacterized membrane protein YbhN (UPF0104 family)
MPSQVGAGRELSRRSVAAAELLRRIGWWRALLVLVAGTLVVLGAVLLVTKLAGYANLLDAVRSANPGWVLLAPAGQVLAFAGYILAFRIAAGIDGGPRLPGWLSTRLVFASLGATRMIAAAGAGGMAVLYWALRRAGLSRRAAVVRVVGLNIVLFGVLGALACLAALAVVLGRGDAPLAMTLPWLIGVPACAALAFAFVLWRPKQGSRAAGAPGRVHRLLREAARSLALARRLLVAWPENVKIAAGTAMYWAGDVLCLWAGLRAFDVWIGASALVLAYATGYIAIVLPLPTGGIGGVDAALTLALIWVGVPVASALLAVFVYRFFNFVVPTLPGLAALGTLPLLGRELELHRSLRTGAGV